MIDWIIFAFQLQIQLQFKSSFKNLEFLVKLYIEATYSK